MGNVLSKLRDYWRPEAGIFIGLWLLLLLGGRSRLFRDPGTFWHTRVGQQMIDSGHLVYGDPFSFTMADLPAGRNWIPHQWLGEWLMAFIHQWKEWDGLLLATVTLLACLYVWVACRLMRAGLHWSLAIVFTALALAAGSNHFHVRPHLATLVFFGMTCAFLYDLEAGRKRVGEMFWLVPAYALWANLHGGLLGGVFSIGLVWAAWTAAGWLRYQTPLTTPRQVVIGALVLGACTATAMLNPYGWRLPATWLEIMQAPHLSEIIQEHARLNPLRPEGMTVLVLGGLYLALLASVRPWQPRASWLLPIVWFVLACSRIRHAPLFGLAAVLAVADVFPHTIWAQRIIRGGGDLFVAPENLQPRRRVAVLVPALFVAACLLLRADVIPSPLGKNTWTALDEEIWPLALVEPLRAQPSGAKIFNELNLGGFVIFYAPRLRVFIDDRCELYGDAFLHEYDVAARLSPEAIERWRAQYGFDSALTLTGSVFDTYLESANSHWKLVARSEAATLYRHLNHESKGAPTP